MSLNRRSILLWVFALLAIDLLLTWLSYQNGTLSQGRSPTLDTWDLAKAVTVGVTLLASARRVGSRGLAVIGAAAILVGVVGGTHLHGILAEWILPGARSDIGKFAVLMTSVLVVVIVLFSIRDSWPHFPTTRRATILLLAALLLTAGILDLIGAFRGAALLEESAERLVMSVALACALELRRVTRTQGQGNATEDD